MRRTLKWPQQDMLSYQDKADIINSMLDVLYYVSPVLNDKCGQIEPPTEYKIDGFLAYADGVNWKPNGTGSKGHYYYDSVSAIWVRAGG